MNTFSGTITQLADDEVFVFGCNLQGFHGAGAAGYASFGVHGNSWRRFGYECWPNGHICKWNVKGKIGPQRGHEGKSYALPTIKTSGLKRSLRIDFKPLYECCRRNPTWKFYYAQEGKVGLNGWKPEEIESSADTAGVAPRHATDGIPPLSAALCYPLAESTQNTRP